MFCNTYNVSYCASVKMITNEGGRLSATKKKKASQMASPKKACTSNNSKSYDLKI